jgi:hypothetical protein
MKRFTFDDPLYIQTLSNCGRIFWMRDIVRAGLKPTRSIWEIPRFEFKKR